MARCSLLCRLFSDSPVAYIFVQRITDAIDNGNISLGVFLDLSKAFDTVSHSILLDKLSHYSLSDNTLKWFKNYLKDRKQYVFIDGINSSSRIISYGVPQGSIFGPILFLIYMNDVQFVTKTIYLLLYADHMNLLCSHNCLKKASSILNKELSTLNEWFQACK